MRATRQGMPVTAVAGTPTRQFIYTNSGQQARARHLPWDLLEEINSAQGQKRRTLARLGADPDVEQSTILGLRAQNRTYQARLRTQQDKLHVARSQIEKLKEQHRLALGARVASRLLIDRRTPTRHLRQQPSTGSAEQGQARDC